MSAFRKLGGKRFAVLAANGFEQVELETAVAALIENGAKVSLIALSPGRIRGMRMHQSADLVRVDQPISSARASDYDGLFIPGGCACTDALRQSAQARTFVQQCALASHPIALMSQAPLVLVSAGLARNVALTSWPGVRDDVVNAGATWLNRPVVRDANYLSGRGPQDLESFVASLVPFFAGESSITLSRYRAQSDPPQERPVELTTQSLRWLATPSMGTMLSLALLGAGVVAAHHTQHKSPDDSEDAPGR